MNTILALSMAAALVAAGGGVASAQSSAPAKPVMPQVCATCHQPQAGSVRGLFENVAFKSGSLQLRIDAHTEIVRFDPQSLKVVDSGATKPTEALRDIAKGREARIEYAEQDGQKIATLIAFKGPVQVPADRLIGYAEVERLVALGPEKGQYTLIDSRPPARVQEGTIPTAINLPYPAFDKFVDRLPQDKDRLTIFFCQGVTCVMSPNSLKRAEALGYTRVRVYREGYPEWSEKNIGVIAALDLKAAWLDKQVAHVLVDVRPAASAREGHIPGAVSLPLSQVPGALARLPDPKLKAPIVVYDVDGSTAARTAATLIKAAGQKNVTIVDGGIDAWKSAQLPLDSTEPRTTIAYAPKPRPGSLPADEFVRIAKAPPADVIILDVRNADEAKAGMIHGAKLMPEDQVAARLAELPKDKRIVTHCTSGVRAEMAYHRLKEAGYQVAFVNADVAVKKDGSLS